jgi:hypothetical protein
LGSWVVSFFSRYLIMGRVFFLFLEGKWEVV